MISSNDLRPGITVELDGMVWQCVEFQHVKPGKGAAFVRAKLKNLQTGSVVERKFNAGIKLQNAQVERKPMQYLYEADGSYCFMDTETYEQIMLNKDQLGDKINFLKEEMECTVMFFNGSIINGAIGTTNQVQNASLIQIDGVIIGRERHMRHRDAVDIVRFCEVNHERIEQRIVVFFQVHDDLTDFGNVVTEQFHILYNNTFNEFFTIKTRYTLNSWLFKFIEVFHAFYLHFYASFFHKSMIMDFCHPRT